jgi:hypothetical protein
MNIDKFTTTLLCKSHQTNNLDYLVSVHKMPFTVLRSSENYSFTISKLRIFGLRKPCK